jgi:hypothetical protein
MMIQRTSMLSGITRSLDIPTTQAQLDLYYNEGFLLQHAFPTLTPDQREFIKTGITAEEWDQNFGRDEWDDEEETHDDTK